MKTVADKYKNVQEGTLSKAQFLRDVKLEMPSLVSSPNTYKDAVKILKNRGIIQEIQKQNKYSYKGESFEVWYSPETGYVIKPGRDSEGVMDTSSKFDTEEDAVEHAEQEIEHYVNDQQEDKTLQENTESINTSLEALDRGIDYELEKQGINTGVDSVSEEQYNKAVEKAQKNLDKNPTYYIDKIAKTTNSPKTGENSLEKATEKNKVDTSNGMKKVNLKEAVGNNKNLLKKQLESLPIGTKIKSKGVTWKKDTNNTFNSKGDKTVTVDKIISLAGNSRVKPTSGQAQKLNEVSDEKIEKTKELKQAVDNLKKAKQEAGLDVEENRNDPKSKEVEDFSDEDYEKLSREVEYGEVYEEETSVDRKISVNNLLNIAKKAGETVPDAEDSLRELAVSYIGDSDDTSGLTVPLHRVKEILANYDLSRIMKSRKLNEGRRPKIKGGKNITEFDYETGGYIDAMNPVLDKAISKIEKVWEEWKEAPLTQPGMIPHAKKDLVKYIETKLKETPKEENNMKKEYQLKEAFKRLIKNVLEEDRKIRTLNEAKTENLEKFTTYENSENPDLAARVRKGATELTDILGQVDKVVVSSKEKIEKVYSDIGPYLTPGVADAFNKDLTEVLRKLKNLRRTQANVNEGKNKNRHKRKLRRGI